MLNEHTSSSGPTEIDRSHIDKSRKASDTVLELGGADTSGDSLVATPDQIEIIHEATAGFNSEQINRILGLLSLHMPVSGDNERFDLAPFSEAQRTATKSDEQLHVESQNRADLGDIFRHISVEYAALYADKIPQKPQAKRPLRRALGARPIKLPPWEHALEIGDLDGIVKNVVSYQPGGTFNSINSIETVVKRPDRRGLEPQPKLQAHFSHGEITSIIFSHVNPRSELFTQAFIDNQFGKFMHDVTSLYGTEYSVEVNLAATRPSIRVSSHHGLVCEYRYDAESNDFKRFATPVILDDPRPQRERPPLLTVERFRAIIADELRVIPTVRTKS